ncbi:MAG: hypothetical protein A3J83_09130, partial [Elusimicrobia bacterium RIFOXYA2_FULL_40_6]
MQKLKMLLVLCLVVMVASFTRVNFVFAGGATSAEFLQSNVNLGVGARAVGMGAAYTAVGNDASSMFWNPASLSLMNRKEVVLSNNSFLEGIQYNVLGLGIPLGKNSQTLGIGIQSLSYGDMVKTDENGADAGTFTASDMAMGAYYSRGLNEQFMVGLGFKSITQTLDSESSGGMAIDLGSLYLISPKVQAGLAIQNLGSAIKGAALPMNIKLGVAGKVGNSLLSFDIDQPSGGDKMLVGLGFELNSAGLIDMPSGGKLALRGGYQTPDADMGSLAGITFGFGFEMSGIGLDYAYVPAGDLGSTNRISIVVGFGAVKSSGGSTSKRLNAGGGSVKEHFMKGNAYMGAGKYAEAMTEYEAILAQNPENKIVKAKNEEAKKKLIAQKAAEAAACPVMTDAQKQEIIKHLKSAKEYDEIGMKEDAIKEWQAALEIDPTN